MGFPQTTCTFLADLARNNDRDWFAANKERYESDWLNPAIEFVSALSDRMASLHPPHKAEARVNGSIRRLQRDTRFSKDKTPYDPKLHLVFWTGDHPNRSPAIHIVLHPDSLGLGAGQFGMTSAELHRYRKTVATDVEARNRLVDVVGRFRAHECYLTEETLKRVPKDFDIPTDQETLLKRKGIVVRSNMASLSSTTICDKSKLSSFCGLAEELNNWLCENVALG
ncbi:MAG: DUF2461 domain-containing protein [Pseudomonadota bacterium]